jgi:hypothetical protein
MEKFMGSDHLGGHVGGGVDPVTAVPARQVERQVRTKGNPQLSRLELGVGIATLLQKTMHVEMKR